MSAGEPPLQRARQLIAEAQARIDAEELGPALAAAREAVALAESIDEQALVAEALTLSSLALYYTGELMDSVADDLRAAELWRQIGDQGRESAGRASLSRTLSLIGDMPEALREGVMALELADLGGELSSRMQALAALGHVYYNLKQYDLAMSHLERAAETARIIGDSYRHCLFLDALSCVHIGMAELVRADGDEADALAHCTSAAELSEQAYRTVRTIGNRMAEANALGNWAEALLLLRRPLEALRLLDDFDLDPRLDESTIRSQHLDLRGRILMDLGHSDEGVAFLREALELAGEDQFLQMQCCERLSEAFERAGDLRAALDHTRRYVVLFTRISSETAQRSARIAAIRLETAALQRSNLELTRQAAVLTEQSNTDPLTQVANRRLLDRRLADGIDGAVLALIDVDHFKHVNDAYSHQVGDAVLRQLARLLEGVCRPADLLARYGGEEFALLLRDIPAADAAAVAERLRVAVAGFDWGTVAAGLTITVSVGLADAHETTGAAADLLDVADRRLYAAKRAGRNRVVGYRECGIP